MSQDTLGLLRDLAAEADWGASGGRGQAAGAEAAAAAENDAAAADAAEAAEGAVSALDAMQRGANTVFEYDYMLGQARQAGGSLAVLSDSLWELDR